MKPGCNFVVRTIRNGTVKVNNRIFAPSEQWLQYDGRLDGMRYAFGLYWTGQNMEPYLYLWGQETEYESSELLTADRRPEVVDGYLPWVWWNEAEE